MYSKIIVTFTLACRKSINSAFVGALSNTIKVSLLAAAAPIASPEAVIAREPVPIAGPDPACRFSCE